jgi:hypothetical protein
MSGAPTVKRSFLMRPEFNWTRALYLLEFTRELQPIAIWVIDEEEQIITRAMPSWSPSQGYVSLGKSIRPVTDINPVSNVIAKMIEALPRSSENRKTMMFCTTT